MLLRAFRIKKKMMINIFFRMLIKIDIITDNSLIIPEYTINLQNRTKKIIETIEYIEKLKNLEEQENELKNFDKSIKKKPYKKKPFFKKKFYKKPAA